MKLTDTIKDLKSDLKRIYYVDMEASPRKRSKDFKCDECTEEEDTISDDGTATPYLQNDGYITLKHLKLHSTWKEPMTMTHRVTVAFVSQSGVEAGEVSVRIVEDGNFQERAVKWPVTLFYLEVMDNNWLTDPSCQYEPLHPEFNGFIERMKPLRARSTNWIDSSTRVYFVCRRNSYL